jgi:uncharacterized protein YjbI with pentapeptide repeats
MNILHKITGAILFESKNETIKATLSAALKINANLSGANLSGADLSDTDLSGANLRDAHLRDANLRDANLRDANLRGANLRDANLRGADLSGADLSDADLRDAHLRDANLRDADLSGANLYVTSWNIGCGSLSVMVDAKFAIQFLYHFCRLKCDDKEVKEMQKVAGKLANKFHLIGKELCCTRVEEE